MSVRYRNVALFEADWTSLVGYGVMLGLAWVLVAFSTARALQPGPSMYAKTISIVIPAVFAIVLFAGGLGMLLHGLFDQALRIARWTVFGTVSVVTAIVLNSIWISAVDFGFSAALFTLVNAAISGAVLGFLVGLYDAHKARLKQDLAAESDHTTELSQRLSVINRVLRHDMRHQTQLIQGHAERLRDEEVSSATAADQITRANDRLLDLAEQARKLQELLGGDRFESERIDLVTLVESACEPIQQRHPDLDIDCQLPKERPVQASPLVKDVLKELLDNAAVHNGAEHPRVSLSVSTTKSADRPVELTVSDNGPGLPETEPVRQEESYESQMHHSNGFGLWFVTWVVEDTGGTIDFSTPDREGVGTEITMRFPAPSQ